MLLNLIDQLQIIHNAGQTHNDIKPDNVVYFENNGNKGFRLIDFGESVSYNNEGRHYTED